MSSPGASLRILLAEHELDLRALLAEGLEEAGYGVTAVRDGVALLRSIDGCAGLLEALPDLVVTDVNMPGLSGLDAVALARETIPDVPVLVITASGDEALREQAARVGACAVLAKPFPLESLLALVGRIVAGVARDPSLASPPDSALFVPGGAR